MKRMTRQWVGPIAAALFILKAGDSRAKEIMIRCTMETAKSTAADSFIRNKLQELDREQKISIRHYVIDESKNVAWQATSHKRAELCFTESDCQYKITPTFITRTIKTNTSRDDLIIDRLAGRISDKWTVIDDSNREVMSTEFEGYCEPESVETRKF